MSSMKPRNTRSWPRESIFGQNLDEVDETGNPGVEIVTYVTNLESKYSSSSNPISSTGVKPIGPWLYPTAYERTVTSGRRPSGLCRYTWQGSYIDRPNHTAYYTAYRTQSGVFAELVDRGAEPTLPPLDSNMKLAAEYQALAALKDQKVNLGVSLGESRMTAAFIGDIAGTLGKSLMKLKRGNIRGAFSDLRKRIKRGGWSSQGRRLSRKTLRKLKRLPKKGLRTLQRTPGTVLAWQYAARPLLNDIQGALAALEKSGSNRYDWVVTAKGKNFRTDNSSEELSFTGARFSAYSMATRKKESRVGYTVRLDAVPRNEFFSTLTSLGVSQMTPFQVAWELTTFSFVADWVFPVGEWLGVLDATNGFDFLSGSVTSWQRVRWTYEARVDPEYREKFPTTSLVVWKLDKGNFANSKRVKRTPYSGFPTPIRPRIKNPLSLEHALNGLSLLHQAIYGNIPKWVRH